jgi:hypothetical protein
MEGDGGGSRTLRRSVREPAAAATCVYKKTRHDTSRRGAGRCCPARKGPPWRGRGEATGDCTATEEPFQSRGCGDRRQLSQGPEITERPTPESLGPFLKEFLSLTLGSLRSTETGSECDIEHRRSHIGLQDKMLSILRYDAPPGATTRAGEGFYRRFPSLSKGIYSFTPHCSHTHRRWGSIGSRGTGRGSRPPGGGAVQDLRVSTAGGTSTGTSYPAQETHWFR